ncbi:hypothetical protein [Bacillus sp. FJAT-49736]|uniref:hypothetical protein n=1 Tax=Bacillus sp. FJAT-49736 TaxID=2833582 RepID=UPI001BCA5E6A|nr:hypothetical protein [Bacillus sp. FJAT-49736]MBS4173705.1 hypothetical protein [Bacillus sp. FJAT-49736]
MLVEINLLQEKETRSRAPYYMMLVLLLITILISIFLLVHAHVINTNIKTVQRQINETKKFSQVLQQKLSHYENNSSSETLASAVQWAEKTLINMVWILKHLIALLPERGFYQSFTLNDDGSLEVKVQFDTSNDAAYYLSRLTAAKWIKYASITSITTAELTDATSLNGENSTVANEQDADKKENVLPRYIGDYKIQLDLEYIKEKVKKGGDGS